DAVFERPQRGVEIALLEAGGGQLGPGFPVVEAELERAAEMRAGLVQPPPPPQRLRRGELRARVVRVRLELREPQRGSAAGEAHRLLRAGEQERGVDRAARRLLRAGGELQRLPALALLQAEVGQRRENLGVLRMLRECALQRRAPPVLI